MSASSSTAPMEHISIASLSHLPSRVQYLRTFIGFTDEDAAALHAAAPVVAPLVPTVVDAVYTKLLSFDITAKAFVPRQTGFTGEATAKLEDLSLEHPHVKFRKDFLGQYLVKVVSMDYDKDETWEYLDKVGLMHTGVAGFAHRKKKPALRVELVHCAILLGYVEDILANAVLNHPDLDLATKTAVLRAVNKILWIQNDLFARHYVRDAELEERQVRIERTSAAAAAFGIFALGVGFARYVAPLWRK
ncbi:hypothetical protein Hypma_008323 [Hypsizygus marmoreus]|uniref:Globin-sensor domain-containing protein n=1 Tax=Hypsizygus marmoreus TaxID=39966 RepID=A0A369JTJ3_HYPMA|nr:hypothetical protein Hypma_008323 [Hypsizygus marmoreus]